MWKTDVVGLEAGTQRRLRPALYHQLARKQTKYKIYHIAYQIGTNHPYRSASMSETFVIASEILTVVYVCLCG